MNFKQLGGWALIAWLPLIPVGLLTLTAVQTVNQHFERAEEARKEAAFKAQWAQLVRECMENPPAWQGIQVLNDDFNLQTLWSSPLEVCDSRAHQQLFNQ